MILFHFFLPFFVLLFRESKREARQVLRVALLVLALARAFPGSPLHTTVHESGTTYAELDGLDIHTTPLQRLAPFRRNPRVALPLLAPAAGHHHIDADVTVCNTTGWAHGMPVSGASIIDLMQVTGLSEASCLLMRQGKAMPHPRHWEALRALIP